ncbi:hypothetical protein [Streptomyces sp. Root369]|uniref:hypothetical protein n=1 Tax=Streptomyces sp. Root369 TaxID=1736523 RepID=UPI000AC00702|nr:hypothetical protein [Streptomyces sp. Root369]
MGELLIPAVTAVVAAALGWAGAYAQARGIHAQANAAAKSAGVQTHVDHLQWTQSSPKNAYTALALEALEFEKLVGQIPARSHATLWGRVADERSVQTETQDVGWEIFCFLSMREQWYWRSVRFLRPARALVNHREKRLRYTHYGPLVLKMRELRQAYVVVEMIGPDDVANAASGLLHRCERSQDLVWAWAVHLQPFYRRGPMQHIREGREQFSQAVRPHLGT